jgi:hypothetical protein
MKLSVEDILINPIERLLSLLEIQGAGFATEVGYRKCPETQQIRQSS